MRRTVAIPFLILLCCSGTKKSAPAAPGGGGGEAALALGTSHLPGLDWGMSVEAAQKVYPDLTQDADPAMGWHTPATVYGRSGQATLHFRAEDPAGLHMVQVDLGAFPSMDACIPEWNKLRAEIDAGAGPSTSENLAAYWETEDAQFQASCDPGDEGGTAARLSIGSSTKDPID